jgi:hypothetical protein
MKRNNHIIKKINKILINFNKIKVAYLFGSVIKFDKFNDIDIGVVLEKNLNDSYKNFKFAMTVARELEKEFNYKYEFDIKILNETPIYFQYEVIRNGKMIYTKDEIIRIKYESELVSKYLDYKPTLDFFNKKLFERI